MRKHPRQALRVVDIRLSLIPFYQNSGSTPDCECMREVSASVITGELALSDIVYIRNYGDVAESGLLR